MLLGTITLRIQSKPAAGEMAKQTQIIAYPDLLSNQNRATNPKRVEFCQAEVAQPLLLPVPGTAWDQ